MYMHTTYIVEFDFYRCSKDTTSEDLPISSIIYEMSEHNVIRSALYISEKNDTAWYSNWKCIVNDTSFIDTIPPYLNNRYLTIQNNASLKYFLNSDIITLFGGFSYVK